MYKTVTLSHDQAQGRKRKNREREQGLFQHTSFLKWYSNIHGPGVADTEERRSRDSRLGAVCGIGEYCIIA